MQKVNPNQQQSAGANMVNLQGHHAQNSPKSQGFCKDCNHFKCTEIDNGKILRLECSLFEEYAEPYDPACLFFNAKFELTCEVMAYA